MIDRRRHMMLVSARAAKEGRRAGRDIACRQLRQMPVDFQLALGVGQIESGQRHHRRFRHVAVKRVHVGHADSGQHAGTVGGVKGG